MSETAGGAGRSERQFAAGISRHPDAAHAVGELVGHLGDKLDGPPSVAVLFVSGSHIDALDKIVESIHTLLEPHTLIGTTAVGLVGGAEEIEDGDAVAMWAAHDLPVEPFRLEALPGHPPLVVGLPDEIEQGSNVVVMADPSTFPVDVFVDIVNENYPGVGLAGGLASAFGSSNRNRIVLGSDVHLDGGAGFVLPPGASTPIVSQGCRPIGAPWVITDVEGQLVRQLGGRPALERLTEIIEGLSDADRAVASRGLHVGVVANEQQGSFEPGDFLIRAVLGADRNTGAVAVGDSVDMGQVLQFQVRDAASASAELDRLLDGVEGQSALVFTCNGRGSHLFEEPNHDAARVHDRLGDAVAGMFCAGEVGPIADLNAVHAFTATVLVFH